MVTENRNGAGALSFTPPLIKAISNNEIVTYNDVKFTMRFEGDITELSTSAPTLSTFNAKLVEHITEE